MSNQLELYVAYIRARLESGVPMERGRLGVSTLGQSSLEWHRENGGIGTGDQVQESGLEIGPVEGLQYQVELLQKYPGRGALVLV